MAYDWEKNLPPVWPGGPVTTPPIIPSANRGGFSGANHLGSAIVAFLGGFGFRILYEHEDGRFSFWDWIIIVPVILLILYAMGNPQFRS